MSQALKGTQVVYEPLRWMPARFIQLCKAGLYKNIYNNNKENYEPNFFGKIADGMLYHIDELPSKIGNFIRNPRVVTIALTALAILAVSLAFYPTLTPIYLKLAISAIPLPPAWVVKFALYLLSVETILGYSVRAQSRFWSQKFEDFINCSKDVGAPQQQ